MNNLNVFKTRNKFKKFGYLRKLLALTKIFSVEFWKLWNISKFQNWAVGAVAYLGNENTAHHYLKFQFAKELHG